MKTLKTRTFAAQPAAQKSPAMVRRSKLIGHLEQQKLLAEDPLYVRLLRKWVTQETGDRHPRDNQARSAVVATEETGTLYLTVRYGAKPLEFEKGKAAILLKDKAKLVATIEMLISSRTRGRT